MERILVGMVPEEGSLWAGIHALNLAKRINAKVSFLLVIEPGTGQEKWTLREQGKIPMMKRMGTLIEQGRNEGLEVDYFVIHGNYDSELVRFIKENRITILVVGLPARQKESSGDFTIHLEKIRHRVDCRIEVVHEKNFKPALKRRR